MNRNQIIRAWKDEGYRSALSDTERSNLPENPAGAVELEDRDLNDVGGIATGNLACFVTSLASYGLSCLPNCGSSFFQGTCEFGSAGCVCHQYGG